MPITLFRIQRRTKRKWTGSYFDIPRAGILTWSQYFSTVFYSKDLCFGISYKYNMNVLVYFNKVLFMYSKVTLSFQHKAASNRPAFHTLGEKKALWLPKTFCLSNKDCRNDTWWLLHYWYRLRTGSAILCVIWRCLLVCSWRETFFPKKKKASSNISKNSGLPILLISDVNSSKISFDPNLLSE